MDTIANQAGTENEVTLDFKAIEACCFAVSNAYNNAADALKANDGEAYVKFYKQEEQAREELEKCFQINLPSDLSDTDKDYLRMLFNGLHFGMVIEQDPSKCEGVIDAIREILPGYTYSGYDYHMEKYTPPSKPAPAKPAITVDPKDVAEFGQAEAEYIAKVLAKGSIQWTKSDGTSESIDIDIDNINKYRQALRDKGNFTIEAGNFRAYGDYSFEDIMLMKKSPWNTTKTIIGRKGSDRGYLDMQEFIRDAAKQRFLKTQADQHFTYARKQMDAASSRPFEVLERLQKECEPKACATLDDLLELYNILYNIYKSSYRNEFLKHKDVLERYHDDIFLKLLRSDDRQSEAKTLCELFGGVKKSGKQLRFDAAKAQAYIEEAKATLAALRNEAALKKEKEKEHEAASYAMHYIWTKASPDWHLLEDEAKELGISTDVLESLPFGAERLQAVIYKGKLTDIADVINEVKIIKMEADDIHHRMLLERINMQTAEQVASSSSYTPSSTSTQSTAWQSKTCNSCKHFSGFKPSNIACDLKFGENVMYWDKACSKFQ